MEKPELIRKLISLRSLSLDDAESAHGEADLLLLEYIKDEEIKKAFEDIKRWYA